MLVNVKKFDFTLGTISIELTKNDNTSLALDKGAKPAASIFKLQRIANNNLEAVSVTACDFESGSEPTSFD